MTPLPQMFGTNAVDVVVDDVVVVVVDGGTQLTGAAHSLAM